VTRSGRPDQWDERALLAHTLDWTRATVHLKCEGLGDEDARRAPLPTSPLMTIAGVVNHLRWVEHWWFEVNLLGVECRAPWTDEDPDAEFRLAVEVPLKQLLDEYEAQCARSRELLAGFDLDTWSKRPRENGQVTLRWIAFHMIEETARHNGQLDLLREMADGVTGY